MAICLVSISAIYESVLNIPDVLEIVEQYMLVKKFHLEIVEQYMLVKKFHSAGDPPKKILVGNNLAEHIFMIASPHTRMSVQSLYPPDPRQDNCMPAREVCITLPQ